MNKKRLAALALLAAALTSCGTQTSQEPPAVSADDPPPAVSQVPAASQEQEPGSDWVTWELIEADYQAPTRGSRLDNIEIPDYNGMDEDAFYARASELGFNSDIGPYPVWAENMMKRRGGRYVAYSSNKDCLDPPNYTGRSIFLLDVETGTEKVLLSGADGHSYYSMNWVDEQLLCMDEERNYILCGLDGGTIRLDHPFESSWGPLGNNGLLFVEQVDQNLRLLRLEKDGSVSRLVQTPFEGEQVKSCAITDDGSHVCYIVQKDMMSYDRYIVLWDTASGEMTELEPPEMAAGEDNMGAVGVELWDTCTFMVEFNVADTPEPNGHNELWKCRCGALYSAQSDSEMAG